MALVIIPHEDRIFFNTPHGVGLAYAVDSRDDQNAIWTVILQKDGRILHYQSLQLRATRNMTTEINIDNVQPPFPSDNLI